MWELSWLTERWVPRRSFLFVSSENRRSTRFSHEELVGVKCRTKRGWASSHRWLAGVVVRGALWGAGQHRQDRRSAIERLDLGLHIDAQHDGALGRIEVEADDIAHLGYELPVPRELPRLLAVRLQAERTPDPRHRALREPHLGRERTRRPVGGVLGRRLRRTDY